MALKLREKQTEAIVAMLEGAAQPRGATGTATSGTGSAGGDDSYKVLILDAATRDILSPLLRVQELRKHGITLHLMINVNREPIPDVPAIYFVEPTQDNVQRIAQDLAKGLYDSCSLHFSSSLPRALLEELAAECVRHQCLDRVAKVYDQYVKYVSLENTLFTLQEPQAYLQLNDPQASDVQVEAAVRRIVEGLFCVLATQGVVPVICAPKGGAAQMVAQQLEQKLREHLTNARSNLFADAPASHLSRPLLCLFDRNVELAVAVQHSWSYKPLVHELLGLHLNKVELAVANKTDGGPAVAGAKGSHKSYELDESDPFWMANGALPFPKVAEEVETALSKYKSDVAAVNQAGATSDADMLADQQAAMANSTKALVSAVNQLPELTERKKMIDKHTNIATLLLNQIKARSLDAFCMLEEEFFTRTADSKALLQLLNDQSKGSGEDNLRLAIVYLLTAAQPVPSEELAAIEKALQDTGAEVRALSYVRKVHSLSQQLSQQQVMGGMLAKDGTAKGSSSATNLLDWADKLYGQSLNAVTAGMKSLLGAGRQLAVTRQVEALMEGKGEEGEYVVLDPRAAARGSHSGPSGGAYQSALVFMIGGGTYLEHISLMELGQRSQPPKHIAYGCTEVLSASSFVSQLALLGAKSGY